MIATTTYPGLLPLVTNLLQPSLNTILTCFANITLTESYLNTNTNLILIVILMVLTLRHFWQRQSACALRSSFG